MKFTFDEVLERIGDDRPVSASDVQARALSRKVWLAEWHLPGCLSESRAVCLTKRQAVDCALSMAEGENGPPRGMRSALMRDGRFDSQSPIYGTCINTVSAHRLADLL
jgi:hypothetical protein